ncbi:MAG: 16S rRNA (guanine(527)-N(7))-methyltransferase RsmG [Anaerolineales bacterium]|nr:16S rRNA (guanine(527)-N(7))-methyltransferase RsmG [Anaerolineales bacterium]
MDALINGARAVLGLELTPAQVSAFQTLSDELRAWNEKVNLTAITQPNDIQIKHFLDSLTLLRAMPLLANTQPVRVMDVGTGAGFPGLPLKIICPHIQLTLLEATGKKTAFCQHMVETLKLKDVTVVNARAEEAGQRPEHRERYDWAVARAVAEMPVLAEYLLPLVKLGGHALAQKSKDARAETLNASGALKKLGGELEQIVDVELPGIAETRYLVVLKKVAATPRAYPRRPGTPSKMPLI